jgi:hypothetical protein
MSNNPWSSHTRTRVALPIDTSKFERQPTVVNQQPHQNSSRSLTTTTTNNNPPTNIRVGTLSKLCDNFNINYDASQADDATRSLLSTLTTLTASRATEHRLTRRIELLQRSRELGVLQSAEEVDKRLSQVRRLKESLSLVLSQSDSYVECLQQAAGETLVAPLKYQQHVVEVFELLEKLTALPNDVETIQWAQDTQNDTTETIRRKLQFIPQLIAKLETLYKQETGESEKR